MRPQPRSSALPLLGLALFAATALPAAAQSAFDDLDPDDPSPYSDAALVAAAERVAPGDSFEVALVLTQASHWHSYWLNGGDAGQPTTLDWRLPEGVTASGLRFPVPAPIEVAGLVSYGYEGEVALLATITVADGFAGDEFALEGTAEWLICADICLPATAEVEVTVAVGPSRPSPEAERFAGWRRRLPVEARGWTTEAIPTETGFDLRVIPALDWRGEMEGATFFPLDRGVINYAAPQPLSRDGEAYVLALEGSGIAATPDVLTGVLALPEDETLDGEHRGLAVRAPVPQGVASAASAMGDQEVGSLWIALLLALGGGLLLNLMPCVFPVLSFKVLGFAEGRDRAHATMRRHGLLFGAGVLVSFLLLAVALLALRGAGEAVGWGFQLQSPPVIAALAVLMTGLGLWMLGVVEFGGRVMGVAARAGSGEGGGGAFLSGVLATVLATPCTAPFMGAALGWALVQPPVSALAVFAVLGVGMALPYVLLSSFPAWLRKLPRPGPWMETLKQALAFPLFLTAVWLVWTFGAQTGLNGAGMLLAALVLVGLAAWVGGRWPSATASGATWLVTRGLAVLALGGALVLAGFGARQQASAEASAGGVWAPYDPAEVEALVAAGAPVFVDFTAAWCLTCQANKASTLRTETVERAFQERGVHLFVADWTRRDDEITAALDALGRSGVPVYALYPGGAADPILLPELLTPAFVLDTLDEVTGPVASR